MLIDRLTNYRSRYGYPAGWAVYAELWWRIEHWPRPEWLTRYAYRRRKGAEHRGFAARG